MPKIVDAEERKQYIARACYRVIARDGIEGLTTRALAREAGVSAGALFHYFDDKNAIVLATYHVLADMFRDELRERVKSAHNSRERLRVVAMSNVPTAPERRPEFAAWLCMWAMAPGSDDLREYQAGLYDGWRDVLEALASDAIDDGLLVPSPNVKQMALHLAALTDGLIIQILTASEPEVIAARAPALVDALLNQWAATSTPAELPLP